MSYIKLDRKMLTWKWLNEPNVVALWIYILLRANYKKTIAFDGVTVDEGCLLTSESKLSKETGLSRQQVRTALSKLVLTKEITKASTKTYTLIKVNKWGKYQTTSEADNQGSEQDITQNETQNITKVPTTYKEVYKKNQEVQEKEYKENLDCSPEFAKALKEYEQYRKKKKKPLTPESKTRMLKRLETLAVDEETQIKIIYQAIDRGWSDVYPLDENKNTQKGGMSIDIMSL